MRVVMFDILLRVFLLILGNLRLVTGHVELGSPFATDDRQSFFRCALVTAIIYTTVLIFRLHVQHIFHIQLEQIGSASANDSGSFVHFESSSGSIPYDEIMDFVIGVRVPSLQRENRRIGRSVELNNGLHRQRPIDKVRRFIVDILDVDNYTLVVSI